MKKILSIVLSLFLISSCANEKTENMSDELHVKPIKFTYENHDYLLFYVGKYNNGILFGNFCGTEHDPNCWCMVDYD